MQWWEHSPPAMWAEFVSVLYPAPRVFLQVLQFFSLSKTQHAAYSSWLLAVHQGHAQTIWWLPEGTYICFWSDLVKLRPCCTL